MWIFALLFAVFVWYCYWITPEHLDVEMITEEEPTQEECQIPTEDNQLFDYYGRGPKIVYEPVTNFKQFDHIRYGGL